MKKTEHISKLIFFNNTKVFSTKDIKNYWRPPPQKNRAKTKEKKLPLQKNKKQKQKNNKKQKSNKTPTKYN